MMAKTKGEVMHGRPLRACAGLVAWAVLVGGATPAGAAPPPADAIPGWWASLFAPGAHTWKGTSDTEYRWSGATDAQGRPVVEGADGKLRRVPTSERPAAEHATWRVSCTTTVATPAPGRYEARIVCGIPTTGFEPAPTDDVGLLAGTWTTDGRRLWVELASRSDAGQRDAPAPELVLTSPPSATPADADALIGVSPKQKLWCARVLALYGPVWCFDAAKGLVSVTSEGGGGDGWERSDVTRLVPAE